MANPDTIQPLANVSQSAKLFPHPVYFVHRNFGQWPELTDPNAPLMVPERVADRLRWDGRDHWTLQTYLRLKARGRDVHLVTDYEPGRINVLHYDDLSLKHRPDRAFIVAIQSDRPRASAADLRLVQNALQIQSAADRLIYLWPQPGLVGRDKSRGSAVERVGYLGSGVYLAEAFRDDAFRSELAKMNMELVIREKDHSNCRDLDVILAVRNVSDFDLSIKPPSKLVNAWLAGCPALLGREPAYQQCRQSPLDYVEVRTPGEAIAALRRLKDNPAQYREMIEHGQRRGMNFTTEVLCGNWETLLMGPITNGYEKWRREPGVWRTMRFGYRSLKHKYERRKFFRLIRK